MGSSHVTKRTRGYMKEVFIEASVNFSTIKMRIRKNGLADEYRIKASKERKFIPNLILQSPPNFKFVKLLFDRF